MSIHDSTTREINAALENNLGSNVRVMGESNGLEIDARGHLSVEKGIYSVPGIFFTVENVNTIGRGVNEEIVTLEF